MSLFAWIFGGLVLTILLVGLWMTWYSKRALEQHREQVQDILEEMRRIRAGEGSAGQGERSDVD